MSMAIEGVELSDGWGEKTARRPFRFRDGESNRQKTQ